MLNRITPFALACAMTGLVTAAGAQPQQTAEGAQRFLALLAKDGHLSVRLPDRNGNNMAVQGTTTTTFRWLNNGVPAASGGPYDDYSGPARVELKWLLGIARIDSIDANGNADPCTTRLDTVTREKPGSTTNDDNTFKKETFFGFDYLPYRKTVTETYEDPAVKFAGPHYVAWGKVVINRIASGRITARAPGPRFNTELVYLGEMVKDPEMADRVEYAMKFLKASCDKTAATGF